jgi:hypothetical protein
LGSKYLRSSSETFSIREKDGLELTPFSFLKHFSIIAAFNPGPNGGRYKKVPKTCFARTHKYPSMALKSKLKNSCHRKIDEK